MKLLKRNITKNGPGSATITPTTEDDLWVVYNLISVGDKVAAKTSRKVQRETASGSTESERVRVKIEISVEKIDYDPGGAVLRPSGRNLTESEYIRLSAYHTLDLEVDNTIRLTKDKWDSVALKQLETACDPAASADLSVIVMSPGIAHVCLVGSNTTIVKSKVHVTFPKKHGAAAAGLPKAMEKFKFQIFQSILKGIPLKQIKCLVLASPGYLAKEVKDYVLQNAQKQYSLGSSASDTNYMCSPKDILESRNKMILAYCSSGFQGSVQEVLTSEEISKQIQDTKALKEFQALAKFHKVINLDSSRALYGPQQVRAAFEKGAIQTLLISDLLFRSSDLQTRQFYVQLVESLNHAGREAVIFSSMHLSGQQINQLSGIAAILSYPCPELEDSEFELVID